MHDIDQVFEILRAILGERCSRGESVRDLHSRDLAYATPRMPDMVVFPKSEEEVCQIVKTCNENSCPVVPFGVGSSLEGQVVPVNGGVSIDFSQMNKIISVENEDLIATVEPGVTRVQLNEYLRDQGLMFTVDPGANASIGGMCATRASGTNSVRYGTMRENVLALRVALPDGRLITTGSSAPKSASGYDLTRLFVGSEGTLGVITQIKLRLFGQPDSIRSSSCIFDEISDAVNTVILAIQSGIPIARVELLDETQMRGMNNYNKDLKFPEKPHLFLEFHGSSASTQEQIDDFKSIAEEYGAYNFEWATKTEERNRLWKARHDAYYAAKSLMPGGLSLVTDVCVPISALSASIEKTKKAIEKSGLLAPIAGHVGDGNYHLMILFDGDSNDGLSRAKSLASQVNDIALDFGGTVTGEHGIGSGKRSYMEREHGEAWSIMGNIKELFDPNNIMNPGKLVP